MRARSRRGSELLPFLLAGALAACSGSKSTVGDGAFQKRRHQTGWHVDLGLRKGNTPSTRPLRDVRKAPEIAEEANEPPILAELGPEQVPSATTPEIEVMASLSEVLAPTDFPTLISAEAPLIDPVLIAPDTPKAKWNPWAVPAFALALSTVAYAILGTSEIIAVLAVILTIVIASIAVRKGRTYEWRGKGFAITALLIGCLSALITVIALLAGV